MSCHCADTAAAANTKRDFEHGHVKHFGFGINRTADLAPVKLSSLTGNLIQRVNHGVIARAMIMHIMPTESRVNARRIIHVSLSLVKPLHASICHQVLLLTVVEV